VEYLVAVATHAGAQGTLIAMVLGAIIAMMGSMALVGSEVLPKVRAAVFFPVAIGVGLVSGVAVAGHTTLALSLFVVVMFAAVFVRRFGLNFFFYGFMGWMGYFFASFLHATFAMMPSLISATVIGSGWVLLLSITVLRTNSTRTLRRTVRAFDAQARSVARAAAELLEHARNDEAPPVRQQRRLRAKQHRLADVALMVEGWSAEPGALPSDWSAPGLRRRLIDAHQAIDALAEATHALTTADPALMRMAVPVLARLARHDDIGANRAADALAEEAALAEARAKNSAGWWPARHLAVAAVEFIALARRAQTPPEADEIDEFSPTVTLVWGDLPGAPAVAMSVAARGGRWNPLARLDMISRQAIQGAVAGGLAILLGWELSPTRYYWAAIAAFIMFTGTGTRAETFIKGAHRVLGTLVGLIASIWLADLTAGHTAGSLVVIVGSIFFGFYLIRVSYGYMIFFITIMVGQLYSVLHDFSNGLLVLRLEETGIGAAIGFAVAMVLVPLSTRDTVRTARDNLLTALAELLTTVADRLDDNRAGEPVTGLDRLVRGLDHRVRQLALVAKPLTRPLLWGNSPPRTRHRLTLYAATATQSRALTVALRRDSHASGPAAACRALAAAAIQFTEAASGSAQPATAASLAKADTALFAHTQATPGATAADPVIKPLIHLHRLLHELTAPGQPSEPEPQQPVGVLTAVAGHRGMAMAGNGRTVPVPAADPSPTTGPATRFTATSDNGQFGTVLGGTITTNTGQAVGGAVVLLLDPTGHKVEKARTDSDGRFQIRARESGRYVAAVSATGYRPTASGVTLHTEQVTRVDLRMESSRPPAGTVRGIAYGPEPVGPLSEVTLTLLDAGGTAIAWASTDDEGRYLLPDLPAGNYTLVAVGYPPTAITTHLTAGADHTVDVTLAPDHHENTGNRTAAASVGQRP
jgi:uncharacterized membrane protein YccC